jgi:tryptophanyl-tRNA synthetase
MKIITDSKGVEDVKNPETCNVFNLYKLVATEAQTEDMRRRYEAGGYGYGHAKQALFEAIIERFSAERMRYQDYMSHPEKLEAELTRGAEKARKVAHEVLAKVRSKLGY